MSDFPCVDPDPNSPTCIWEECLDNLAIDLFNPSPRVAGKETVLVKKCCLARLLKEHGRTGHPGLR